MNISCAPILFIITSFHLGIISVISVYLTNVYATNIQVHLRTIPIQTIPAEKHIVREYVNV